MGDQIQGAEGEVKVTETPVEQQADGLKDVVTLSIKELEAKISDAVEKAESAAAKKERDKLYDTINALKDDLTEAKKGLAAFNDLEAQKKKKEEELRNAKMTDDEKRDDAIKKANLELEQLNMAFERLKTETEEKLKKKDVELYREKLLAKFAGRIIPEMVSGASIEELEESAKKAVDRFNFIRGQVAEELNNKSKNDTKPPISTETPQQQKVTLPKQEKEYTAEEIRRMSPEEYAKYKESLLGKYGV